ncbi:hypothetical protein ISF_07343 [Cordyceps fumosorosea ARSEF 2679]|uniref:Uncharacterized protein n=1 Tax=Cordyceps fumosorosea (strain ARSEF 2679) TaxID=1081104 RepID=A0A167PMN3_CORFA|nr:hypothetical protein ISF_07343 [Cordyceps fumosorosea ARSEF 2679]OAA56827.1 hypothetical protein ISF_07343 [Cordyceps fumosorosea ARSEF 2679]
MIPSPASARAASSSTTTLTTILAILLLLHPAAVLAAKSLPVPLPTLPSVTAGAPPDHNHHQNANVNRREQQPSAPYTPLVTQAPSAVPDADVLQGQGFRQETYYTCITAPSGREHCGWHTPLLRLPDKEGSAAAVVAAPGGHRATDTRVVVAAVAALAGLFAVGMM